MKDYDDNKLRVWWNSYKDRRAIRVNQRRRFWAACFEELGLKRAKVEQVYVYVTPEERGRLAAKRFKKALFFIRDFIVYCCKKIYDGFKWFFNALMDAGDYIAKQNNKSKK